MIFLQNELFISTSLCFPSPTLCSLRCFFGFDLGSVIASCQRRRGKKMNTDIWLLSGARCVDVVELQGRRDNEQEAVHLLRGLRHNGALEASGLEERADAVQPSRLIANLRSSREYVERLAVSSTERTYISM